jgi:hypothetical protein
VNHERKVRTMTRVVLSICVILLTSTVAAAEVPRTMSYQGVLNDTSGQPIEDGNYEFTFKIYNVPSGGTALWTGTQTTDVINGVFHVILGQFYPLDLPFDEPYWLGISTGGEPEFTPRVQLAAAPYALRAQVAEVGEDADWTINGSNIYRSNGNVGVGTSTPATKLSVGGLARIEGVNWPSVGAGMELAYYPVQNRGYIQAYDRDTDTWGDLYLGNGNVGIGTVTPSEKLQVSGLIYSTSGGFKFPDGTVQTTANGGGGGGLTLPYSGSANTSGPAFSATNTGSGAGIQGITSGTTGVFGSSSHPNGVGVKGESVNIGVWGAADEYYGVYGYSATRFGVYGLSPNDYGVYGQSETAAGVAGTIQGSTAFGYLGYDDAGLPVGVFAENATYGTQASLGGFHAVEASKADGTAINAETEGFGGIAVRGNIRSGEDIPAGASLGRYDGSYGYMGIRAFCHAPYEGLAGFFQGDVEVTGWLTKPLGSFKIDHPLDPTNKNLYHSFVESPDMMNVYNGNVVLDETGEAWVQLPDWFEALNRDFRYQLTAIGAPGPNLHVGAKIDGNRFRIAGGTAGMEVSWQVTGIRQDPYAEQHRIPVEEWKSERQRGKYLYPEVYGQPPEQGVNWDPKR